ncbi:AAA-ATPase [Gordonia phage Camerico]|nr:AAA-ATPase [Gordonia phage Camerico]
MTIPTPPPLPGTGTVAPAAATIPTPPSAPLAPSRPHPAPMVPPPAAAPVAPPSAPAAPSAPPQVYSCKTCIFYIAPDNVEKQTEIAGRMTTASAICGKFGTVLSTTKTQEDDEYLTRELTAVAGRCGSYVREDIIAERGLIDDSAKNKALMVGTDRSHNIPVSATTSAPSCQRCIFHVNDADMMNQIGVMANGCRLKNIAIPNGQAAPIAAECSDGIDQDSVNSYPIDQVDYFNTFTIDVFPHLTEPREIDLEAADNEAVNSPKRGPGRPRKEESEDFEPASAEDNELGIKGWFKAIDADNKSRFVMLPVFDPQYFDDNERAKIPMTGDDEHPEKYVDHQNLLYKTGVIWRKLTETPALNGISGVGKTEFFRYFAWKCSLPFERISITNSTELDDLAGKMTLQTEGEGDNTHTTTVFEYGRIPKAWAKPCVIVIDEPNVGPPDVWQFIRPLTDSSKQLVLDVNRGERISRHPHCYMGMAFNPTWDMRNVGTHEISDADGSRLMHISIPAPTESLEKKIIKERCKVNGYNIETSTLDSIMAIAKDIRALAPQDFPVHWGVRQQIKVARATEHFDMIDCYRMAAADLLDPDDREQIFQAVKAHVISDGSAGNIPRRRGRPRKQF